MKCEECLPLIEEYVDGELDGRMLERLSKHLSTCAECASELSALRREQEIYARYRRDIIVTPAQWNIIRARIEQEKEVHLQASRSRLRQWLEGAFGSRRQFRTAFAAAVALLVIGITAGVIYLNSRHRPPQLAGTPAKQNEIVPPAENKRNTTESNKRDEVAVNDRNRKESNPKRQTVSVASNPASAAKQKNAAVASGLPRRESPETKAPTQDDSSQFAEVVADRSNIITGVRRESAPKAAGDFDFEMAHHAERAELLLRSFRNVRPPAARSALDVSYEKKESRKLLYENIALRRDAASRGDQSAAELLNTLEPILLDIANLPDRVKARDVRSIEERMQKKEIVAALQVRTLLASN